MRVGDADFEHALDLVVARLREVATRSSGDLDGRITYRELSEWLAQHEVEVPYHDGPMPYLLEEASRREHEQGRGLISALVVDQDSRQPNGGFYRMARRKPFNRVGDEQTLWWREVERLRVEGGGGG